MFAIDTGVKAIQSGYSLTEFCLCLGHHRRRRWGAADLLPAGAGDPPAEIYALAALLGTVVLWFLHPYIGLMPAAYLSMGLIERCAWCAPIFKINLPLQNSKIQAG